MIVPAPTVTSAVAWGFETQSEDLIGTVEMCVKVTVGDAAVPPTVPKYWPSEKPGMVRAVGSVTPPPAASVCVYCVPFLMRATKLYPLGYSPSGEPIPATMFAAVSVVSVKAPVGPVRAIWPPSSAAAVSVPLPTVVIAVCEIPPPPLPPPPPRMAWSTSAVSRKSPNAGVQI